MMAEGDWLDLLATLDALIDAGFEELTVSPKQWVELRRRYSEDPRSIEVKEHEFLIAIKHRRASINEVRADLGLAAVEGGDEGGTRVQQLPFVALTYCGVKVRMVRPLMGVDRC